LVEQQRQIAITLNPLRKKVSDDGFRSRPDDVRLFQLFAAGDGDDRQLGREALHVLRFFFQEALRDQQRQINVLVAGGFEAIVELALDDFPHGVPVGLDHHAALDDFGRLGHVALEHNVLIPGREILVAGSDTRFCH